MVSIISVSFSCSYFIPNLSVMSTLSVREISILINNIAQRKGKFQKMARDIQKLSSVCYSVGKVDIYMRLDYAQRVIVNHQLLIMDQAYSV